MALRKRKLSDLIAGYIREIEKDFSQIIPKEINQLLFEYYYNPFIWKQDGFHGDSIIFVDEHTIKTKQAIRGIAVVDTVIDASLDDIFDFKVIIKDLDGLVTIGFFPVNDDNNPDIKSSNYNEEIHSINGALIAVWTGYDNCWTCIDSRVTSIGVEEAQRVIKYPMDKVLERDLTEIEIGIRFDMKQHSMKVYFGGVYIGTPYKEIPDKIIPAIGMYGDTGMSSKCTVIIKQEEISSVYDEDI